MKRTNGYNSCFAKVALHSSARAVVVEIRPDSKPPLIAVNIKILYF
jgi:hypothetical protein